MKIFDQARDPYIVLAATGGLLENKTTKHYNAGISKRSIQKACSVLVLLK